MASRARSAVVLALIACCLALTGCASPAPPIVSSADREHIRRLFLDEIWNFTTSQYPEAIRPKVPVMHTADDHDYISRVAACLRTKGFRITETRTGFEYNSGAGRLPIDYAVAEYFCFASYPSVGLVSAYLDVRQRMQLSRYYALVVRPCLLSLGEPSPPPDQRSITGVGSAWSPYALVWASNPSAARLNYLEARCPSVPEWLQLSP